MHPKPLTLRPVHDADLDVIFEHQSDPAAVRMAAFTADDPSDRAAFDGHWARIRGDDSIVLRAIVVGDDLAGHICSYGDPAAPEVTYWIDRAQWGRGVATRALRALLDVVTARPITARVAADNSGSIRVLEKCGFVRTGEARGYAAARRAEIAELEFTLNA